MENDQFARQQASKPGLPQRGTADSPCVAICSTLFDDVCRGCGRTVMEVSNWVFMSPEEKDACWDRILSQGFPKR
jgi:predicted Fe-S protein YdhL (DUF1289 family)